MAVALMTPCRLVSPVAPRWRSYRSPYPTCVRSMDRSIGRQTHTLRSRLLLLDRTMLVSTRAGGDALEGLDLDDLMPDLPDEEDLHSIQEFGGAIFSEAGVPLTFGNDDAAIAAMRSGMAVVDRCHWGRVRVTDEHRIDFLQNQTTADFKKLSPGQGTDTVFSTPAGRTVDLVTGYVQERSVMLITSPTTTGKLVEKMNKFIFMADKVEVNDISDKCCMFSLLGPKSADLLKEMQAGPVVDAPYGTHSLLNFKGSPVMVAAGGGLPVVGFTLIADTGVAGELWRLLVDKGAVPAGEEVWEQARVMTGRPAPGSELTDEFSVLEAGLYSAASLNKGCYLGQETIAKVHNKDAVKQQLWGIEFDAAVEPGTELMQDGKRVGVVTSYAAAPTIGSGHHALGYVRCRVSGQQVRVEGMTVDAGGVRGVVTQIPFPTRDFAPDALPQTKAKESKPAEVESEEDAAEKERKAKKLAAMEARVAAYMAAQKEAAQIQNSDNKGEGGS